MKNFCLYNGKKIVKPEIWNITSVELASDYTSAIIQAESKINKSEYNLDITPLIINQYKTGIDPYSATVINDLTGVTDWVIDPANNQIRYSDPNSTDIKPFPNVWTDSNQNSKKYFSTYTLAGQYFCTAKGSSLKIVGDFNSSHPDYITSAFALCVNNQREGLQRVANPSYDPNAQQEQKLLPLEIVAQKVISNAQAGNTDAQNSIVSTFNNMTDTLLNSDYSEFFEQNKQPK